MNAQTQTETTKARRNGSRGRGTSTVTAAKRASTRGKGHAVDKNWHLPVNELEALGQEMANAAVQQVQAGTNYWDRCRTQYIEAQNHGRAQEALVAIFKPGESVKGKKAPWYRTYKSILTAAAERGIEVTNDMGMSALQKLIKENKEQEIETDPEKAEAKRAQMLGMFVRLATGCLNMGISKRELAEALKEIEA